MLHITPTISPQTIFPTFFLTPRHFITIIVYIIYILYGWIMGYNKKKIWNLIFTALV